MMMRKSNGEQVGRQRRGREQNKAIRNLKTRKIHISQTLTQWMLTRCGANNAGSPSDDAEVIDVPRRQGANRRGYDEDSDEGSAGETDFRDFKGVIDTVWVTHSCSHTRCRSPSIWASSMLLKTSSNDLRNQLGLRPYQMAKQSHRLIPPKAIPHQQSVDGHKIEVNETVLGAMVTISSKYVWSTFARLVRMKMLPETPEANANGPNSVTSAPTKGAEESESDERREPLEKNCMRMKLNVTLMSLSTLSTNLSPSFHHKLNSYNNIQQCCQ
ncbi:unnamed protein product [Ceratitis capitata]|uniref:(Mediterranean fruit fly) hypothetical protein n=1 Tax=Ceratitis capitata TaxID=7213 RepID=A0A811UJ35_CERCA|nr:unnamed protein product [Ceratitis capitata]